MDAQTEIPMSLTRNQWYAVINALRHTHATYVTEHGGVNLETLADTITRDVERAHQEETS